MRYDLNSNLTNVFGKLIRETQDEKSEPTTLRAVLVQAILAANPQKHADGAAKYKLHKLVTRVQNAKKALELDAAEVVLLKDLVGDAYPIGIVGPVFDLLEGGAKLADLVENAVAGDAEDASVKAGGTI